jgi:uncharacterized damage-inducible protein DinB
VFRRIDDFAPQWRHESESTLRVMKSLTDGSLAQPIVPGGRTLGFLAWHITGALSVMTEQLGLAVPRPGGAEMPGRAADIATAYERTARAVLDAVKSGWTDEKLTEALPFYGRQVPAGVALEIIIRHQTHHRGQMTVLMRQAGVPVPGVYGPSKEEWAALGMPARD